MSGGSMDYVYFHIEEAAELTEDETITQLLTDLAKVLHDEEWAESGDISDAKYQDTLLQFKRKWLEQESKTDSDCISRRKAIHVISACDGKSAQIEMLEQLPSVNPTQKTGHWIVHPKGIYANLVCDKCLSRAPYNCETNYCPNCGAKMESEE